jgi:hypothetical protein
VRIAAIVAANSRAVVIGHPGARLANRKLRTATRQVAAGRHDHAVHVDHIVDDEGRQSREHDSRQFAYVTRDRPCRN